MAVYNRGFWDELPEQCKRCEHMRAQNLYMSGNHYYLCKRPVVLTDKEAVCSQFKESVS